MTTDTEALKALVAKMKLRFSSGNSVPVQRAHINDDEWAVLLPALERMLASQTQEAPEVIRSDTKAMAQYVTIKLHGGSGYTVHRNHADLGDAILGELDGLEAGDKITLTFRPVNISDEQYEHLGDFEGH